VRVGVRVGFRVRGRVRAGVGVPVRPVAGGGVYRVAGSSSQDSAKVVYDRPWPKG
jgi:hypothetical protein